MTNEEKYAYLWEGRMTSTNLRNPKAPKEAYKRYHFIMEYEEGIKAVLVIVDTYLAPLVVSVYRFPYEMVLADKLPKKDKEALIAYGGYMIQRIVNILNAIPTRLNTEEIPTVNMKNFT